MSRKRWGPAALNDLSNTFNIFGSPLTTGAVLFCLFAAQTRMDFLIESGKLHYANANVHSVIHGRYGALCRLIGSQAFFTSVSLLLCQDDDDYESPFSGDEEGSGGDYESPNEEVDGNDYEPPPSEPPEDLPHQLCPLLPAGDDDYIGNHITCKVRLLIILCNILNYICV